MSRTPDPQRRALWLDRLDRFDQSQLTIAEFCRRESVSMPSFYQWRKKLTAVKSPGPKKVRRLKGDAKFMPVVLTGSPEQIPTVQLPGGATIQLPVELGKQKLAVLISAVIDATICSDRTAENV
jgi:hypothetical protein